MEKDRKEEARGSNSMLYVFFAVEILCTRPPFNPYPCFGLRAPGGGTFGGLFVKENPILFFLTRQQRCSVETAGRTTWFIIIQVPAAAEQRYT